MTFKLTALLAAVVVSGCTDVDGATQALDAAGYKNVQTNGYSWFGCGRDDSHHTKFTATGANGKTISGVVCKGITKGSTIRTD